MGTKDSASPSLVMLVRQREDRLKDQLRREREAFENDMAVTVRQLLSEIPACIMKMTLAQFLALTDIFTESEARAGRTRSRMPKSTKSSSIQSTIIAQTPVATMDRVRRVTRSMTRDSLHCTGTSSQTVPIMTPKFHPGLPETPAMLRDLVGGRKRPVASANDDNLPRTSNIFVEPGERGKIRRVTRATIRGASLARNTRRQTGTTNGPPGGIGGVVSVELDDGKMLDLDIGADPTTVLANMGPNMVRDLGRLFRAYAAKMSAFYKKCKVSSKGEVEDHADK